ncbi:MAG: hypothetical protein PHU24_01330 [Sphaerochaetaceae bacterium]|nr:hypothetical protein [Sphaerochaetaceae bacterium]NLO61068.1 hypothetical protein [Spirochaetales bacterium]MDD2405080.1 hypothetical protein [Sphaerochaetaceae bacterium]MDD4258631.1 hypothetical protein [Sphaerochaetaceae bacterium]MDD4763024.1 hypothetical protein [Sphaerochaetaceae bacterium]
MDVRRLQLWEGRNATVLSNESIRSVIEDQGGMVVELSNTSGNGGRLNAHPLFHFRSTGISFEDDDNKDFWRNNKLFYFLGGNFFCFPNFGGPQHMGHRFYDPHGWTANSMWVIKKYGTDSETGANWVLSTLGSPDGEQSSEIYKIDMVLPGHPVLYTSVSIKNLGSSDIIANAAWHNTVGPPFLESGCIIDVCAKRFATAREDSEFVTTGRLAFGKEFDDLAKAPQRDGTVTDLSIVPGMIGNTDFVTGSIPAECKMGWSSVINPRLKMVYFSFFPGPAALEADTLPLYFNNLWMQYGGRPFTPWALYDGGTDQVFCLGVENSTGYYAEGLSKSKSIKEFLSWPTTVTIAPQETKVQRYGTAFAPYENPKMMGGIHSVEQVVEGIVLKHGKAWSFIDADSLFVHVKSLEAKLIG